MYLLYGTTRKINYLFLTCPKVRMFWQELWIWLYTSVKARGTQLRRAINNVRCEGRNVMNKMQRLPKCKHAYSPFHTLNHSKHNAFSI